MKKLVTKLRNYFLPHRDNEFSPHFLRHQSMTLVVLLVLVIELGFLVQVFVVFDNSKFLAQVLPGVLTSLTNEQRQENNLPQLAMNETLTRAATLKAQDMAAKGYFAHTSPEGKTPWYWFEQVGYKYSYAGENLAVNFFESNDVAEAWMNSPTHRANIVKKDYTEIGIGVARGMYEGRESVFVAQLFGTPAITSFFGTPTASASSTKTKTTKPAPVKTPTTKKAPTATTKPAQKVATNNISQSPKPTDSKVLSEESTSNVVKTKPSNTTPSLKYYLEKMLLSPRQSVTYLYELLAFLIFLSIVMVRFVKYERQHSYSILRGLAVLAVIGSILYINMNLPTKTALKLPTDNQGASVINGY